MKKKTTIILASALLAAGFLATDAQARGGEGGHMGGFGGSHFEAGIRAGAPGVGPRYGVGRHFGGYGPGLYGDGLECTNIDLSQTQPTWPPGCS